jgi:hypothetical protein
LNLFDLVAKGIQQLSGPLYLKIFLTNEPLPVLEILTEFLKLIVFRGREHSHSFLNGSGGTALEVRLILVKFLTPLTGGIHQREICGGSGVFGRGQQWLSCGWYILSLG